MDQSTELLQLEDRRCEAMKAADFDPFDKLLSDQLTWTHASARQETKASFMAVLRIGDKRYLEIRRSEERVRSYGDVAVLTGVADMRASINGEERRLCNRYTNVWAKAGAVLADGSLAIHYGAAVTLPRGRYGSLQVFPNHLTLPKQGMEYAADSISG